MPMNPTRRLHAAAKLLATTVVAGAALMLAGSGPAAAQTSPQSAPPPGCTGPASATWLNVVVDGVRNGNGLVAITLYADDPSKFLIKRGSLYVGRVDAKAGTTRACIFVPKPGVYALALYHDENANTVFDRTSVGFPEEGFGFSNNPPTLAGLPSFKSVRINVPKPGLTTHVSLKYP